MAATIRNTPSEKKKAAAGGFTAKSTPVSRAAYSAVPNSFTVSGSTEPKSFRKTFETMVKKLDDGSRAMSGSITPAAPRISTHRNTPYLTGRVSMKRYRLQPQRFQFQCVRNAIPSCRMPSGHRIEQ